MESAYIEYFSVQIASSAWPKSLFVMAMLIVPVVKMKATVKQPVMRHDT